MPTLTEFFGVALAERIVAERGAADLVVGNNVLAQVPDLNDFVAGIARSAHTGRTEHSSSRTCMRLVEGTSSTRSTTSTSRTSRCH